jgi:hypothetical protein
VDGIFFFIFPNSIMKISFALTAIISAVAALPSSSARCSAVSQNANFDDLPAALTVFTPIPTPYKGLLYQGFTYLTAVQTGGLLPGIVPHSGNNYAAIGVASMTSQGTPMLTVNYPSSQVASFQLKSWYFGCAVQLANQATAVPSQCTINVTGYQGSDNTVSNSKQVCSQSFSYNPSTAVGAQQQAFGSFNSCAGKDIQFAIVQYSLPGGMSAANALAASAFDDIKYTTKAKTCKS